jgi:peptide/nickel transport system substrate-binding protein
MTLNEEQWGGDLFTSSFSRRQALGMLAAGVGAATVGIDLTTAAEAARPRSAHEAIHGEFHGAWPYLTPPSGHYNTFLTDGTAFALGIYQDLMETSLAMYYWHAKKWLWLMATSGKFVGGNQYVVNLRQGAKWSDGTPFNAQDVINTWTLWHMLGNNLFDYVDTITAPNDHTVVFHMKVPSTVVERYVLHQAGGGGTISGPRASSVYGSWAKRFRDLLAAGHNLESTEVKSLRAQFLQVRPKTMVVSGPFMIDPNSITQGQLSLVRNPHSWASNLVGFEKIILYNGETPTITPVVLAGQVDYATHGFPPATDRAFVKKGFTVLRPPTYYGFGILPNYKKVPAFRDKRVREAIMYMINRPQMGPVVEGPGGIPNKRVTGFSDILAPDWLNSSTMARLNPYPYNPSKGVAMLEGAGWKKGSDGIWVTPSGQKATWEVLAETEYVDVSSCATNFVDQLAPYGFKLATRTVTFTQTQALRFAGDFELTATQWAAGDPHPHFSYVQDVEFYIPPRSTGPGSGFNPIQKTNSYGTVDLRQVIDQSGLGLDVAKQRALVDKMAVIYNDLIPFFPFVERYGGNPTIPGKRVAGWPKPSDPIYLNSPYSDSFVIMMLLTGQLHAV